IGDSRSAERDAVIAVGQFAAGEGDDGAVVSRIVGPGDVGAGVDVADVAAAEVLGDGDRGGAAADAFAEVDDDVLGGGVGGGVGVPLGGAVLIEVEEEAAAVVGVGEEGGGAGIVGDVGAVPFGGEVVGVDGGVG